MKDYLADAVRRAPNPVVARNVVREYLQARILGALQGAAAFVPLAFHGGTSLRFLFSLPRWSEDLDFALQRPGPEYDFHRFLDAARAEMAREGYAVDLAKVNDRKVVHSAFVRFSGLLHELGLSGHRGETISVKLEVDTNPPAGARLETTVVRRHVLLRLQHHDKASLLAGKLAAILQREYAKGRDVYDLLWYLGDRDWPAPNLEMLNAALRQGSWKGRALTPSSWKGAVRRRIAEMPWARIVSDVRPFIEREADLALMTRETLLSLLA